MMAKKPSALAGIFDDESETAPPAPSPIVPEAVTQPVPPPAPAKAAKGAGKGARNGPGESAARRGRDPGKKAVLTHIQEDMHRTLRQLRVVDGGEDRRRVVWRRRGCVGVAVGGVGLNKKRKSK